MCPFNVVVLIAASKARRCWKNTVSKIYASTPLSEWQKARDSVKTIKGIKRYKQSQLLAVESTDLAIKAIRSLRTSLHFAMMQAAKCVDERGELASSVKTFVCANAWRR